MKPRPLILAMSLAAARCAPALAAALPAATDELAAPRWSVLSASGTAADYPANVFSVDAGASPRGAGRSLRTADGRAGFTLFVLPNRDRDSPRAYLRKHLVLPRVEYRAVTDRFFVVSGYDRDRVFYTRCNFPRGASGPMQCISLVYPRAETHDWDAVVTRISHSLRPAG